MTRKHFVKLMMSKGHSRARAEELAEYCRYLGYPYSFFYDNEDYIVPKKTFGLCDGMLISLPSVLWPDMIRTLWYPHLPKHVTNFEVGELARYRRAVKLASITFPKKPGHDRFYIREDAYDVQGHKLRNHMSVWADAEVDKADFWKTMGI